MLPIVVSHYTKRTGYEAEVEKLRKSLDRLDLTYYIEPINNRGSWRANSNYVSQNVLNALETFPDRDVLRVDADAIFHKHPAIFLDPDFAADVAAHVHNFPWRANELMGGTLFFRNKPSVRWFVRRWSVWCLVTRSEERPGDLLQELLNDDMVFGVTFAELPDTYCKIFDIMRHVQDPVIEHFQASRRFRRQINRLGKKTNLQVKGQDNATHGKIIL